MAVPCDVPCDGNTAIILSVIDTVDDLRYPVAIEAMGTAFSGHREGGPLVEDGRIRCAARLPLNTNGGHLTGGGRLHAFGYVHEAVTQLRGGVLLTRRGRRR